MPITDANILPRKLRKFGRFGAALSENKKKILVVDDEPDTVMFLSNLLVSDGFEPIVAENMAQGLWKARTEDPAVILIDVAMPREAGIEMYRTLKQDETLRKTPVIILSNLDRKTFMQYQRVIGSDRIPYPDAYLVKPPEAEELLGIIRKLSNHSSNGNT